jgi:site-specific DNA recombinase
MSPAIYGRVSTERQTVAHTIDQQIERLTAYVHAQGETLRPEQIFRDDGYSGATLNRPGLDRLRDRVKEGTIDRVLMASPDRLARHDVQQMVLLEAFAQAGCGVECSISRWAKTRRPSGSCKSGEPWPNMNAP